MQSISETLRAALEAGNPQRCLIVFEDDEGTVTEEFSNEEIVSDRGIHITGPFNSEKELTLGLCPTSQITFTLLNDEHQLVDFEFGTFRVYLGARIDEGTPGQGAVTRTYTEGGQECLYEFSPLGVFIVDRPDIVATNVIDVRASDRMTLFDKEIDSSERTTLTSATTLYGLLTALCGLVGVTLATQSTDLLNADLTISLSANTLSGRTYRDVLRWIAEAAGSIGVFNRDGELEVRWFFYPETEQEEEDSSYDENNYSAFSNSWYETDAIDGLKVRNNNGTNEATILPTGAESTENPYVISGNPLLW